MKKYIIALSVILIGFVAAAQDTVRYPDQWYGYTYREALCQYTGLDSSIILNHYRTSDSVVYFDADDTILHPSPFFTDIATQCNMFHIEEGTPMLYGIAITMDEADFDTLPSKVAVYYGVHTYIDPRDGERNGRVDSIVSIPLNTPPLRKQCTFEYDYSLPTQWSLYSNCYEFYFDTPLDLTHTDSVYIGISVFNFDFSKMHYGRDTSRSQRVLYNALWWDDRLDSGFYISGNGYWDEYGDIYKVPIVIGDSIQFVHYYEVEGWENSYWAYDCSWGGLFPIVQRRCTAPRGLRLFQPTNGDGDYKREALWRGDSDAEVFQLSLCYWPVAPDSASLITLTDTIYRLPETDTGYLVYLRKMCTFAFNTGHTDTVWSDWSGPLVVGDTTGFSTRVAYPLGIDGAAGMRLAVTPNPASGEVTVRCGEPMATVAVYNAAGDLVHRQQADGLSTTLDTRPWPAGIYLLRITTGSGTATKKLVVE